MNVKQTVKLLLASIFLLVGYVLVIAPTSAFALGVNGCETETAIIKCTNVNQSKTGVENTGVWSLLTGAIKFLSIGVGVAAVGGIVYAAILYTSAGGNAEQLKKAMGMITNTVIGVIAYALMFSLLNFLIPGGLFR